MFRSPRTLVLSAMATAGTALQPLLSSKSSSNSPQQLAKNSIFLLSLLFNLISVFVAFHDDLFGSDQALRSSSIHHWSAKAAAEAERLSALSCSGHGKIFVDTVPNANGEILCECNRCFAGDDCSTRIKDCEANVESGNPMFLEPFWDANAETGTVVVPPSYRMGYKTSYLGLGRMTTFELENLIRQIHEFVGNAVVKDKFILIGTGSMELINAAVASLAPEPGSPSPPAIVVSQSPYYQAYKAQTEFFASKQYVWGGEPSVAARKFANTGASFIEFVAAPNNPDASMKDPVLALNGSFTVIDRAYYWPHYSPIYKTLDDDLMLFTLSKLTGHAGSRLGWAIIRDPNVYTRMALYVGMNTIGVSHDTQLRASRLLRAVLEGYSKNKAKFKKTGSSRSDDPQSYAQSQQIFHFGQAVMSSRWNKLVQLFANSTRFSLQNYVVSRPCSFFKATVSPSPAYAWVKCEGDAAISKSSCFDVFKDGGIIGRAGGYGDERDKSYVRFSLLVCNDDFDNFVEHLSKFLA